MSTKTTFKRVALVAVASLGFGVLSTVAPASAATVQATDVPVAAVATLTNTTLTYAGRVGQQVSIPVTGTVGAVLVGTANIGVLSIATAITSQPATSAIYPTIATAAVPAGYVQTGTGLNYGAEAAATTVQAAALSLAGAAAVVATVNYAAVSAGAVNAITAAVALGTVTFTPTVAGVYTIAVWNENDRTVAKATSNGFAMFASAQAALSGSESFKTFTINVGSTAASTVTLTGFGTTSAVSGASGSLVKVSLKDAAGNITIPATGETVTLTPSGSGVIAKVNDAAVSSGAGAAYNLAAADFGQTGTAWVNITDGTAQDITVTATISGSSSAAIALSFKTVTATATNAPRPYSSTATGYAAYSASGTIAASVPLGAVTTTYVSAGTYNATTVYHKYSVADVSGRITGAIGATGGYDWDAAAGVGTTDLSAYSVTMTSTLDTHNYTIANSVGTTTTTAAAVSTGVLTLTPATINATSGSSVTITGTLKDTFGRALASTVVTASVTGRNPTTVSQSVVTDSLGNYSFVIADANTTSLLTSDSVTVGSTAYTTTSLVATILYGTANAAAKVVVSSDDYTDGVANNSVAAKPIVASTTYLTGKAGAEAGIKTITAVITNAAGAILAGVPVKWTVSGTTAAILSTKATTYTDNTGTATTSVYAWATGTYTVTATAGAVTGTATETFAQSTAASARTISATVSGGVVTAMAKDRFGNPVSGVRVYAKIASGSGFFGTGVLSTYADTDATGTAAFVVAGGSASVTVSNISFSDPAGTVVGQTGAAAGYDIGGVDATKFGASVAGTATVAEYGVGSSFSAAGVASATVAVELTNASETAADAAAEATDAANAATDAANAAAEAADAATAAAQDAADAVAALSTQVSEMVNALKKQITALTNLVIKIQKKVKA
jgi:trimeric autotransporter adhesin